MHPHRLQPSTHPPQPPTDRRRRRPDQGGDRPVPVAGRPRDQRGPDHRGRISPPQQHRDRQQHVRDQARRTPGPAGPQRPDAPDVTSAGPPPRGQHPRTLRARNAAARQPGLDQILIRLYRDQRVPPCIRARPSRTGLPGHVGGRAVVQLPMLVTVPVTTTGLNSTTPRSTFLGSTDDEARLSDRHPERWSTLVWADVVRTFSTHSSRDEDRMRAGWCPPRDSGLPS